MLEAWRSLHGHGRVGLTLGTPGSAGRHGEVAALGKRHIFEISHRRSICGPAAKMIGVRPLHVGDRWVIQEVGALLSRWDTWRGRQHFWHTQQAGSRANRASALWLALETWVGNRTNSNLLHQSQEMFPVSSLSFLDVRVFLEGRASSGPGDGLLHGQVLLPFNLISSWG